MRRKNFTSAFFIKRVRKANRAPLGGGRDFAPPPRRKPRRPRARESGHFPHALFLSSVKKFFIKTNYLIFVYYMLFI